MNVLLETEPKPFFRFRFSGIIIFIYVRNFANSLSSYMNTSRLQPYTVATPFHNNYYFLS
jgi:hypothetical protein